jgi:hypothetical protein
MMRDEEIVGVNESTLTTSFEWYYNDEGEENVGSRRTFPDYLVSSLC